MRGDGAYPKFVEKDFALAGPREEVDDELFDIRPFQAHRPPRRRRCMATSALVALIHRGTQVDEIQPLPPGPRLSCDRAGNVSRNVG